MRCNPLKLAGLFYCLVIPVILFAQPIIGTLSPGSGPTGSSVIISGAGFNGVAANNLVNFGGVRAAISSASPSSLTVTVPTGMSPHLPITITTNALTGYSPGSFIATFPGGGGPLNNNSFAANPNVPSPGGTVDITLGDMDGDGRTDLITANESANTFSVYKNVSSTTDISFVNQQDFPTGLFLRSVATGDLDGDGLLDVIASGSYNSADSVAIYRNTSTGGIISFTPVARYLSGQSYSIVIGEIDGDGKPDIVSIVSSGIFVYRNTATQSTISFANPLYFATGQFPQHLALCDVNGNGKADIISSNGAGTISVLNNSSSAGNVSFDSQLPFNVGFSLVAVAAGDLDNDGKPDIAVCSYDGYKVHVLKNTGSGGTISFTPAINLNTISRPWGLQIADINGDGKNDLICPIYDVANTVAVFRNITTSNLSFDAGVHYYTGTTNWKLVIGDFRNTGIPDIATIKRLANAIGVLRNKIADPPTITSFTPGSAGQGFVVSINGTNLSSATSVSFGGIPAASFAVQPGGSIRAMVGNGASGIVSVTTPAGTATMPGFVFTPAPVFTSFFPTSGTVGQRVKITGSNFDPNPTGNKVYFGGAKATVNSASPNTLYVTVPPGAMYQPITVTTGGYTVHSRQPFNITFPNGNLSLSTFMRRINKYDGFENYMNESTMADIDGDGLTDIIVPLHGTVLSDIFFHDSIAVYRNTTINGIISFARRVTFKTTGSFTNGVSIGDFDSDGKLDITANNQRFNGSYCSVDIFRNTSVPGTISLAPPIAINAGDYPSQVVAGDIDGDRKTDMAVAGGSGVLILFKNISTGSTIAFDGGQSFPIVNGSALSVCLADLDGDGKPDLAASSTTENTIAIFRNISTIGTINMSTASYVNAGRKTTYIHAGDLDDDGKADLVAGSGYFNFGGLPHEDSAITLIRNVSTPGILSFASASTFQTIYPRNTWLTDMDGDGRPDIVAADDNPSISVFKNNSTPGNLALGPRLKFDLPGNVAISAVAVGDLDGDGKPDIMGSDYSVRTVSVLINQNGSDVELCPNESITIFSNITGFSYQWQLRTGGTYTNIGVTSPELMLLFVRSDWSGFTYRCIVNGIPSKDFTLKFVNRWTGAVNTSWDNAGNWSCGSVPDMYTDVVINSGTVIINSNTTIRSLRLDPDVVVTVNPPNTLTILH